MEESENLKNLSKHLKRVTKNSYTVINNYLSSKNEESKYRNIRRFLEEIDQWKTKDNTRNENVQMFSQFVRNMVYHTTQVYPNVIRNGQGFHPYMDAIDGYKKWNLSNLHVQRSLRNTAS